MPCTNDNPCKNPSLRWFHSDKCYEWYKERKNKIMYPPCEKGTACIDDGCTEEVGSSCDCSCHRISSPPQGGNQEKRCPRCGEVIPWDLLGEHFCKEKVKASGGCTNESPCKNSMLRWVHSDRCKEFNDSKRKLGVLNKRVAELTEVITGEKVDLLNKLNHLTYQKDGAYSERNKILSMLAHLANFMGWKVGIGQHPESDTSWDKDWRTILFIEFPTGQGSWHFHDSEVHLLNGLPKYDGKWDGHSTEEKYKRLAELSDFYRENM